MPYRPRDLMLVLGCLCSACNSAGPEAAASRAVRDSAGIQVIEIGALSPSGEEWRLAAEPEVVIGEPDGPPEQQLYRVLDVDRLPDGRIAVANAGTSEIRFYGPDGNHLWSTGREGDGPGEFRALGTIDVTREDSIFAWDLRAYRVSVLDPEGNFVRSFLLAPPAERDFVRYRARFEDGTLLAAVSGVVEGPPEDRSVGRGSKTFLRYSAVGEPIDTLMVTPNQPSIRLVHSGGRGFSFFYIPFSASGVWAVNGNRVHEATGDTYEVRTRDQTGRLVRILRIDVDPIPVTDGLFEAYAAERLAEASGDAQWLDRWKTALEAMPRPERARVFDALEVDGEGRLWVRRTRMPADSLDRWDVFDREGSFVARALFPSSLRVRQIGPDFVLALRRDELDLEQVVVYRLEKS